MTLMPRVPDARHMLWGLSHLFYPWGFVLQILALVHVARRRPDNYWIWIILFGGFLGVAVYIVVEVLPDAGLLADFFTGSGRRSRIQQLETAILDNPSAGNYEELADLLYDQKSYARPRRIGRARRPSLHTACASCRRFENGCARPRAISSSAPSMDW